ncbi:peptidase S8/S53 domain-containing protein [Pestalotiopsis sp. NC0098]|nr:peptidase S8/S53 domain-containing protein [Pestalotiopsis sp. NC0098]
MSHTAIVIGIKTGAIKEYRSWIGDPTDIHDSHGHGTHMVELILKSSENVDIFVAKIANNANVPEKDIELIADAINHANRVWKVDIITMSFGFKNRNAAVEAAIKEAAHSGKIMFAAASNGGNNNDRTYPARDRHVICMSASNGKGKVADISPAALPNDDNFMTLGVSVPLFWKGNEVFRSGTSYATPIAVGFAINVLEICNFTHGARLVQDGDDMRRVLRLLSVRDGNHDYIAPWFFLDNCKDFQYMVDSIENVLQL